MALEPWACPPHHWQVTSRRIDRTLYYHHHCLECGADKDVPVGRTAISRFTWARPRAASAEPRLLSTRRAEER